MLRDAEVVLFSAGLPSEYCTATLSRLAKSNLSESRRKLIFNYKIAFESLKHRRAQREGAV